MTEAMTDERLAEIRTIAQRTDFQHLVVLGACDDHCPACMVSELLAEAERLQGRESMLREHVAPVRDLIAVLDRRQGWRYESFHLEDGVKRLCAAIIEQEPEDA